MNVTESAATAGVIEYPSEEVARCPFPHLGEMRRFARVYEVPGREPRKLSSRTAATSSGCSNSRISSSQGVILEYDGHVRAGTLDDLTRDRLCTFQTSDPPKHTVKRKLAFDHIKPGRIKQYEPVVAGIADELIDGFIGRGRFDFMADYAKKLASRSALTYIGLPPEDSDEVLRWADYDGQGTRYQSVERQQEISKRLNLAIEYVRRQVRERYETPRGEIFDAFIKSHVETFGVEEGLGNAFADTISMLLGAVTTTAHAMGSLLDMLLDRPDDMQRVRNDPKALARAIEEGLRLRAPLQWQNRLVTEDTELAGVPIPAGSLLVLSYQSGSLDEEAFGSDAAEFDLDRRNTREHLSFGYGPHSCVGAPFARLMASGGFQRLFARCDNLRRVEPAAPEPVHSLIFWGFRRFDLDFDPHDAATPSPS